MGSPLNEGEIRLEVEKMFSVTNKGEENLAMTHHKEVKYQYSQFHSIAHSQKMYKMENVNTCYIYYAQNLRK